MESDQRKSSKLLTGVLVGSVLGAVAGFLLAPKSGRELRSDIKMKTRKALDETKRLYSDGRTRFESAFAWISGKRERVLLREIESPEEIMGEA